MRGLPDVASGILMTHQERSAQDQHMLGEVDAFIISKRANSAILQGEAIFPLQVKLLGC
jgi:hypothetical protein